MTPPPTTPKRIDTKQCDRCHNVLALSEFTKYRLNKDGLCKWCRSCTRAKDISYYNRNKEKSNSRTKISFKKWYSVEETRERVLAKQRARAKRPEIRPLIQATQRRMMAKYPEKYKARYETKRAILRGDLIKKPCEVCGDEKSQAHHPDYSKPLMIIWLCMKHHRIEEGKWVGKIEPSDRLSTIEEERK